MSTRRSFIRNGILVAGGLMLPGSSFAHFFQPGKKKKVIVIGAGFSGLAAACKLKEKNFDVTVLESTGRIGGRVFSHQMGKHVVELGAEWVGNSHSRIIELCGEFNLKLDPNQMDSHVLYKGKHATPAPKPFPYTAEWDSKFDELKLAFRDLSNADKLTLDQMDWWHYLVNNGCNGRDLDIRELLDSTDFGESIRQVSAFAAMAEYAESSEKNEMDMKIRGGNTMLALKLSERLGKNNILTSHAVTRVEQDDTGVKVYCANGKMFEADKIICTLPTFAMKKIDWQPGLPQDKTDAINELQYARINKHVMLFNRRFWKAEDFDMITDQLPHYFYHATQGQAGPAGALISYTIGDKAAVVANQSNDWNFRTIKETLKPVFGDVSPFLKQQANYYWGNDERSHGSYALYGPGQWFGIRRVLKAPFLHTHFAGEHLAEWQGFMEGAINTGEDAALEI